MQQTKLESFFKIQVAHNPSTLGCFIYDPLQRRAFFANAPEEGKDKYISKKAGIHLYYREHEDTCDFVLPNIIMSDHVGVPLLKSNLQKAIRRGNTSVAANTAFAMLKTARAEFFRRLAIIYIEDVCLHDSYPIIVWLMMSDNEHTLRPTDYYIILNIIQNLCECSSYYEEHMHETAYIKTHVELQSFAQGRDQLLALYYRFLYGGMKCDMSMLSNAISYYLQNPNAIFVTKYNDISIDLTNTYLIILDVSIDFHPFPHMLYYISNRTGLSKERIKQLIWEAESSYNIRKPSIVSRSTSAQAQADWALIRPHLSSFRATFL